MHSTTGQRRRSAPGRAACRWAIGCGVALLFPALAPACPFCVAIGPTLVQEREAADVVALAEFLAAEDRQVRFRLHQVTQGAELLPPGETLQIERQVELAPGRLALLLGSDLRGEATWQVHAVDEVSAAYFFQAPSLRRPAAERLRYFARFLEHRDPWIAADAIMEFAHAPYELVVQVADAFPMEKVRQWLLDPRVLDERKGFYGLLLGMAPREEDRVLHRQLLRRLVEQPASDFRSGFDGMLSGFLLLTGEEGLELIEARYLADPQSADGDVRHVMAALRFYEEYGREIPPERLHRAVRRLLLRPEFAAAAITDLARWKDAGAMSTIVSLFARDDYPQPATRRAVVGYLLALDTPAAAEHLAELRRRFPAETSDAQRRLPRPSTPPNAS